MSTATVANNHHAVAAPALLASVPDPMYATEYVHRMVYGRRDFDILDTALNQALNLLLFGPTGDGKTSLLLAYAAATNRRMYTVPCNVGVEPSQVIGKMVPDSATKWWKFHSGPVTDLIENGGLLYINEVNFLPERVAPVFYGVLDKRRELVLLDDGGRVVRAHRPPVYGPSRRIIRHCWCPDGPKCPPERWLIVAADMNPDYEGTRPLNRAFRNRFPIQLDWGYDKEVEKSLVRSEVLLNMVWAARDSDEFRTPLATNMMQEFERLITLMGLEFAVANFISHFDVEEQVSMRSVFDAKKTALEDDYKKLPAVDGYDNVFSAENSRWMLG